MKTSAENFYTLLDRVHIINSNFDRFVVSEFAEDEKGSGDSIHDPAIKEKIDAIAEALGDLHQAIGERWSDLLEEEEEKSKQRAID